MCMTTEETTTNSTTEVTDSTDNEEKQDRSIDELIILSNYNGLTDGEVRKLMQYYAEREIEIKTEEIKAQVLRSMQSSQLNNEQMHYENIVDYMNQVLKSVNNMQYASV